MKNFISAVGKNNYAININAIDNAWPVLPFGQQIEARKVCADFCKSAKKAYVNAKGKSTLAAVKKWIKENNPSQFYACWQADSSFYKDDVVEIFYKDATC